MTNPNKGRTMEHADSLVQSMGFAEQVEEYELVDMEHVYTLKSGCALVIPVDFNDFWYVLENEIKVDVFWYKERMGMY